MSKLHADDSARLDFLAEVTNLSVLRDMGAMLKGEEVAKLAKTMHAIYVRFEFHRRFRPTEDAFRLAVDDARRCEPDQPK